MMNAKGIRRKKSSLSEVKVVVLGAPGVGKSALAVRFLTRRYIGEYDHQSGTNRPKRCVDRHCFSVSFLNTILKVYPKDYSTSYFADNRYKHEVLVDNEPVLYEILDTCPKAEDEYPSSEIFNWADGVLLVYSITDRRSFGYVKRVAALLAAGDYDIPLYIVANKNDMVHLRQVSSDEGAILARDADCAFAEVAAAEQVVQVAAVFHELCKAVLAARRKSKHSLLERMLGTRSSNLKLYARGKSDSALPKD